MAIAGKPFSWDDSVAGCWAVDGRYGPYTRYGNMPFADTLIIE